MYLIQMLLPLQDNEGRCFPRDEFDQVPRKLAERWDGATAFLQLPAEGTWKEKGEVSHDEMVMIEVMADELDRN